MAELQYPNLDKYLMVGARYLSLHTRRRQRIIGLERSWYTPLWNGIDMRYGDGFSIYKISPRRIDLKDYPWINLHLKPESYLVK